MVEGDIDVACLCVVLNSPRIYLSENGKTETVYGACVAWNMLYAMAGGRVNDIATPCRGRRHDLKPKKVLSRI